MLVGIHQRRDSIMTTAPATLATPATLMTADEFTARYANVHAELVQGVVKESPMPGLKHGKICMTIGRLVANHVEAQDLGHVMSSGTWIRTGSNPDTVRGTDVCFVSYERLPKGDVPERMLPITPELAVEVRSPSDRWTDVFTKVVEYLKAGVRVVVVLDPPTATASVYRDDELQQIFHNSDPLTLPDVLPGFSVPVDRLFT
jgi:Uma2 family endonuclease